MIRAFEMMSGYVSTQVHTAGGTISCNNQKPLLMNLTGMEGCINTDIREPGETMTGKELMDRSSPMSCATCIWIGIALLRQKQPQPAAKERAVVQ